VVTELDDPAVLEHGHPIGVVRGVEAVGDGDDRPSTEDAFALTYADRIHIN
jgi:hypothetical protein